jgi:uncharacterized protein (DUF1015 family)
MTAQDAARPTAGGRENPGRRSAVSGLEIAPLRGLRYDAARVGKPGNGAARSVTAPPYDVISPDEHRRLLEASPYNIVRITLGTEPGGVSSYAERARLLGEWIETGVLELEDDCLFYVYSIDYRTPGGDGAGAEPARRRFLGFTALGKLHPFAEGVVLPHERTFPKVVDDRLKLLEATRANLESIFLLYSDPSGAVDKLLEALASGRPAVSVEAKPGEVHALHPVSDVAAFIRLSDFMSRERPIIADGHHRYTTSLRYAAEGRAGGQTVPGSNWQMMTFTNLHGPGLSILGTHRLVKLLPGAAKPALERLRKSLEACEPPDHQLIVETREGKTPVRFPARILEDKRGVARTSYALLHDVVLGEWLRDAIAGEDAIRYFKQGTGEDQALASGEGDILFRMNPVDPREFQEVVEGGELFPHKTTFFYPKLWSGLVIWPIEEPERLALK